MAGAPLHAGRAFAASSPGLVFANCLALLLRRRSLAGRLAVLGGVLPFRMAGLEFFARFLGIIALLIGHYLLFMRHKGTLRTSFALVRFNPGAKLLFHSRNHAA